MRDSDKKFTSKIFARRKNKKKSFRILISILIVFTFVCVLGNKYADGSRIPQNQGEFNYHESNWTLKHDNQVIAENIELPVFKHLEKGEHYSISTILTYDGSKDHDPACFYFVDHMFTNIYLNGEKIFSYTPETIEKRDKSKSPGNIYTYVQLPEDCKGQELVIEVIPALSEKVEYQFTNPTFGDYASVMKHLFLTDLPHNIIVTVLFLFGVIVLLFATFSLDGPKYYEGVYIGIFAMLVSLYNLTESDFDFYVVSNPYFTYLIDYISFSTIPIFFMAFLRERFDEKRRKYISTMIYVGIVLFAIELFLHFNGLMDLREFLPILHIEYMVDFIVIFLLVVSMKRNHWKKSLILQLFPLLLGAAIDVTIYYRHWKLGTSDSTFISLSVLVIILIEFHNILKYSKEIYVKSVRGEEYKKMAYIDSLTGIGNRRAYEIEKDNILKNGSEDESIIIVSADINKLKNINDNYGHAAGDFIIRNAANVLADLPGEDGQAFRVGGDEFLILIYDISLDEFELRLKNMHEQIAKINNDSNVKLSLALGYELYKYGDDFVTDLESADEKMYQNKSLSSPTIA